MINLKSCRGAITLYILVSLLFFIIALVNVQTHLKSREDSVELEYQKIKSNYEQDANEVYNSLNLEEDISIKSLKESGAVVRKNVVLADRNSYSITIPKNFRIVSESPTLVTEGIIIEDSQGNQYVWIPIFSKEQYDWGVDYSTVESIEQYTDEYYTAIETALKNYTKTYANTSYTDVWYGDETYGQYGYFAKDDIEKTNLIYYTNGNMTEDEYKTLYNNMLNSIYINEGFYIGRYEMGIGVATSANNENDDTSAQSLARSSMSEYKASKTNTNNTAPSIEGMTTPVSKKNAVAYNYITQSQAQMLAEKLGAGEDYTDVTSSIMFGVQWDAVCVFIEKFDNNEEKNNITIKSEWLTNNDYSNLWGNYANSTFTLDRGYYNIFNSSSEFTGWIQSTTILKAVNEIWLCTTGAVDKNSSLNIYDFSGNLAEWTLEKSNMEINPCVFRGNYFKVSSYASYRNGYNTYYTYYRDSSRVALYIN